jgi:uncharacterized repeat protein (TIGR03809 family)
MPERQPAHAFEEVAQRWRVLADRRRAHFLELYRSGRWRRYYSEARFLVRMHEAIRLSERWAEIAPPAAADIVPEPARTVADSRTAA